MPAIAEAPANQRMAIVEASYVVPKALPRYSCARKASARPLACPPGSNWSAGISRVVTNELVTRKTLISTAAAVRSRLVPRIRPVGRASVSVGSPPTCGITATPVSKPDMPSASLGKTISETPIMARGLPCCCVRAAVQSGTRCGWVAICQRLTPITTTLRAR